MLVKSLGGGPAPDRPEVDRITYAVGDLHGRADLLRAALDWIEKDAEGRTPLPDLIFLGDYIDRGPEPKEVLDTLVGVAAIPNINTICLKGNHEAMLLDFLERPETGARWLRTGGLTTLLSFGVGAYETSSKTELRRIAAEFAPAVAPFLPFLRGLEPCFGTGNVLFTHAGADPGQPADAQPEDALVWGHAMFERRTRRDGVWVVHGHRVVPKATVKAGRIAIDTGAYASDRLTVARFRPGGHVSFQTTAPGRGMR